MLSIDEFTRDGLTDEERQQSAIRWLVNDPKYPITCTAAMDFIEVLPRALTEVALTEAEQLACVRRAVRLLSAFVDEPTRSIG